MVASLSARGNATSALAYYGHLAHDSQTSSPHQQAYYLNGESAPGRWAGHGAERLSLNGPVTESEFKAALTGYDPKTGERLVQKGGQSHSHSAGWDMTFSAPKSISVLWALSEKDTRTDIEAAQKSAALKAASWLENNAGWCRRGKNGALRQPTAGLLIAQFDHETSRDRDPQLHTHSFIFNQAPRKDGTWGAIVSRDLYKAQTQADAVYQQSLAQEIEKLGYQTERGQTGFRVAIIPQRIEKAFSKRQQAIEIEVQKQGYTSARQRDLAALKTRKPKTTMNRNGLFKAWKAEAKALEFELGNQPEKAVIQPSSHHLARQNPTVKSTAHSPSPTAKISQDAARIGHHLGKALQLLKQPSALPGTRLKLTKMRRRKDPDQEAER
ncbi:MobF family relaxase [Paremcibacter congregatus]|uniref:MobF family relaxase n=1 Tax=Paremcibacter congregatus TaxID=2043170 RepID=UPI0030ED6A2A|tara:strand:- start:325 stop:1473 length:1149 start_codon:yes stop_codon:yes gene_type:complete